MSCCATSGSYVALSDSIPAPGPVGRHRLVAERLGRAGPLCLLMADARGPEPARRGPARRGPSSYSEPSASNWVRCRRPTHTRKTGTRGTHQWQGPTVDSDPGVRASPDPGRAGGAPRRRRDFRPQVGGGASSATCTRPRPVQRLRRLAGRARLRTGGAGRILPRASIRNEEGRGDSGWIGCPGRHRSLRRGDAGDGTAPRAW